MKSDPEPAHVGSQTDARDAPPPVTGPMEADEPMTEVQASPPTQPSTPQSRPNPTSPTHPSGMWFYPMSRCARREGASPTGWSCLQSLVSHLLSVHLSTGTAPPDAWIDTHGLRVWPGLPGNYPTRVSVPGTTLLHGGAGSTLHGQHDPPVQALSPLAGPLPAGLDTVHLLGTRIPTVRRVTIAASSTCALALNCLLKALEREPTWETLARMLLFPRIALTAPAGGGKATRSSSTQQCRLNCLAAFMDPLRELNARIHRQATTDGPRTRAQTMPQHRRRLPLRPKPRT